MSHIPVRSDDGTVIGRVVSTKLDGDLLTVEMTLTESAADVITRMDAPIGSFSIGWRPAVPSEVRP